MYPEKSRHLGYLVDPCSICIFFHRSIYIHRSTCHRRRRTSRRTRSFRRSLRRWRIPTSTRRLVLGWGGDGARVWLGEKIGGVVKFFTEFLYRPNCFFLFFFGWKKMEFGQEILSPPEMRGIWTIPKWGPGGWIAASRAALRDGVLEGRQGWGGLSFRGYFMLLFLQLRI